MAEVVSQLLAAWAECSPELAEDAGKAAPALEAMAAILQSLRLVLEKLSAITSAASVDPDYSQLHSMAGCLLGEIDWKPVCAVEILQYLPAGNEDTQKLTARVIQKLGHLLPAQAPPMRCSPARLAATVQLNLAGMQLFTSFLQSIPQQARSQSTSIGPWMM